MKKIELFNMITQLELRISKLEKEIASRKLSEYPPNRLGWQCLVCGGQHPIGMQCPRYYLLGKSINN